MRLLYVGMKYDYGKQERGYSFEHYNFFDSLRHYADETLYFDFMSLIETVGRARMNARLLEVVKAEKPDAMFTVLFKDELDKDIIRRISQTNAVTINWFCDDHWRFENFSRHWAPCFNWVVTTAQSALPKYAAIGYSNVIKSQWACNHFLYRKLDAPLRYDVTFVGQPHGNRRQVIEYLAKRGISYGQLGISNVKSFRQIFGDSAILGDDIDQLVNDALSLAESEYKERILEQQRCISNHTYVNKLLNIARTFDEA